MKLMRYLICDQKHELLYLIPLVCWLILFQFLKYVPEVYRYSIDVTTLPLMETSLFGGLLNDILSTEENGFLVMFAAAPYLFHFALPWVFALYLMKSGEKPVYFLWILGWLNAVTVVTHFFFPTAPPWYLNKYGFAPANYDIKGDAAGLLVADQLLQIRFFENLYRANPVVFGAFPSLHAAWPFLIATHHPIHDGWMRKITWVHVIWVWWAAMYLKHHYLVDILGGVVYVIVMRFWCDWLWEKLTHQKLGKKKEVGGVAGGEECWSCWETLFFRREKKRQIISMV